MILYHGTDRQSALNIKENGVDLTKGRKKADFGQGFYLTPSKESAILWARRKSELSIPYLVSVDFDIDQARRKFNLKEFLYSDEKWAQFIINNRNGLKYISRVYDQDNNLDHVYPVVIGQIADGNISYISRQLEKQGLPVSSSELREMLEAKYPKQISLHTPEAVSFIRSFRFTEIK